MELANKGLAQLAELYRSLTPAARATAALLLIITAVSVAYLFKTQTAVARVHMMGGETFSPAELRQMQAAFGKAGLEAEVDGARIKIPLGQESKYMAALADAEALPSDFGHHMQQAVSGGSFLRIPHSQQEAARRVALQRDLQRAIGQMHGIERAFVQIDEQQIDDFPHPKKTVTAAVMAFPDGDGPLDADTVRAIQKIMISSRSGLTSDAVTVVDMSTNDTYCGDGANISGRSFADLERRQELEWKQTIGEVLRYIPGVQVSTNVELETGGDGRQPGTAKRVMVSVNVPHTYHVEVWRREHPPAAQHAGGTPDAAVLAEIEAREKQKIESLVGNLLPRGETGVASQQVAVSTFYPPEETEPASVQQMLRKRALAWAMGNWRTLSLGGFALVGLALLGSLVRSIAGPAKRSAVENRDLPPTLSLVVDPEGSRPTVTERFDAGARGSSLRGELADAVRNDPDAALSVLRTWIGKAG